MGATRPRCLSLPWFPDRKGKRFRDWIKLQTLTEFKPNEEVVEVGKRTASLLSFVSSPGSTQCCLFHNATHPHVQILGLVASEIVADVTILAKKIQNDALPQGMSVSLPSVALSSGGCERRTGRALEVACAHVLYAPPPSILKGKGKCESRSHYIAQ
jgi:hypothetical protein